MRHAPPLLLIALSATAAFASPDEAEAPAKVSAKIDALLEADWHADGVKPAKASSDAEFFRRLSLDVTGVIPSEADVRAISGKKRPKKGQRDRLIQALLHSRNYASFMATRWANLLVGRDYLLRQNQGRPALVRWLQQQFAANTRWDVVAQQLIAAEGRVDKNGAAEYLVRWDRKPEEMAGNIMRVFQGQQVQCAQCHDHPYKVQWRQKDFWGVAAFFARVAQVRDQAAMTVTLSEKESGEVRLPGPPGNPGPRVAPRFITGESIDPGEGDYRRTELARILTSKNNPWFVRATVNRVWSFFFGDAFTDVDDMDKPDHADVLAVLEADFRASGYDMRRLAQVIVSTRAYQLTSTGPAKGKDDQVEVYARARLRPLTAEQLWWSFEEAVGLDQALAAMAAKNPDADMADRRRNLRRQFFAVFGKGESGPNADYSLTQAFALLNGVLTNDLLWADRNPVVQELLELNPDQQIDSLFRRVLGRRATKGERSALRNSTGSKAQHLQDILWALLNSSEFLYNH